MFTVFAGCTKARPYKEVPKVDMGVQLEEKSIIDTRADYLYVPSTLESSRTSSASMPNSMGDAQIVRFVFTENALKVIAPEKDGRFSDNPTNAAAVLTIPIENLDYQCARDDFGKCTHKEEENNEIRWDKKRYFRLKPEETALQQVTGLPVIADNFFSDGQCYREVGSEFINVKMDKDAVNLILEKTYQASAACLNFADLEDLGDITFTVRYQHSFAKLNTIVHADYKPAQYTRTDERNFGFFNTKKDRLDVDNSDTEDSRTFMFDRWYPNQKVVYYMSDAFAKPENEALRQATRESFDAINDALGKAGTSLRVEIRDPKPGLSVGDLRANSIVLVEDPQAISVIGFGPHAVNPRTGEIVHARVVMYLGTIKKYIKYNYDELVQQKLAQKAASDALALAPDLLKRQSQAPQFNLARIAAPKAGGGFSGVLNLRKMRDLTYNPLHHFIGAKDLQEKVKFMSDSLGYPADMFNFSNAIAEGASQVIDEMGLKPWDSLTEAEKSKVIAKLVPFVWVPTLVHELGHNLGLRHNFAGSEDKANFYTQDELQAMGVKGEFKYSSVMDYAYKSTNELHSMGKYDIAALRYGYSEQVELSDGRMVSLTELRKNPALQIRNYGYCTDEHVDANPNCNRFDEGSTLTEIARHYVEAYQERYKRSNFRNGRRRFSLYKDSAQIGAIDDTMFNLRLMFERYETIKNEFDLKADAPEWESIDFLKDLKQAVLIAGNFYLDVLKTPDLMCAVAQKSNPAQIAAVVPIRVLSKRAITCFDTQEISLNSSYEIVAEGGKNFQSRKDPHSDNAYADEIDVRGIWMDKLLAAQYLFQRQLGSSLFDQYTENFLNMPEMQGPVMQTVQALLTDELQGPVAFRLSDGSQATVNLTYKLYDASDANNSHKIPALLDRRAAKIMGLDSETALFQPEFFKRLATFMPSTPHAQLAEAVLGQLRVTDGMPNDGRPEDYLRIDIGNQRYFTRKTAAGSMILAGDLAAVNLLGALSEEQIKKILEAKTTDGLSEQEQAAKALGDETIQKFANGGFQDPSYYALMIQSLARLNP